MYSFKTKVRYSEINSNRVVRPDAIVAFLQDCTMFHTNSVGGGVDFYKQEHRVWVLNSWQVDIKKQIEEEDEITVCTWPYDFAGAYGHRNFLILNEKGEHVVEANTLWVFADTDTGRPVKLTEDIVNMYDMDPKLDMECLDRKIKIPTEVEGEAQSAQPVLKSFIDTNGHVNNCKYVGCAAEYIPEGYFVERIRAEYKRPAVLGDTFYPVVYKQKETDTKTHIWVALNNADGQTYATVQFDIYK